MAALNDPHMFAKNVALGSNDQPLGKIRRLTGRLAKDAGTL